jgi:hypothetical protein
MLILTKRKQISRSPCQLGRIDHMSSRLDIYFPLSDTHIRMFCINAVLGEVNDVETVEERLRKSKLLNILMRRSYLVQLIFRSNNRL